MPKTSAPGFSTPRRRCLRLAASRRRRRARSAPAPGWGNACFSTTSPPRQASTLPCSRARSPASCRFTPASARSPVPSASRTRSQGSRTSRPPTSGRSSSSCARSWTGGPISPTLSTATCGRCLLPPARRSSETSPKASSARMIPCTSCSTWGASRSSTSSTSHCSSCSGIANRSRPPRSPNAPRRLATVSCTGWWDKPARGGSRREIDCRRWLAPRRRVRCGGRACRAHALEPHRGRARRARVRGQSRLELGRPPRVQRDARGDADPRTARGLLQSVVDVRCVLSAHGRGGRELRLHRQSERRQRVAVRPGGPRQPQDGRGGRARHRLQSLRRGDDARRRSRARLLPGHESAPRLRRRPRPPEPDRVTVAECARDRGLERRPHGLRDPLSHDRAVERCACEQGRPRQRVGRGGLRHPPRHHDLRDAELGPGSPNEVSAIALLPDDAPAEVKGQLWVGGEQENNLSKGMFKREPTLANQPGAAMFPWFTFTPFPTRDAFNRNIMKASFHDIIRLAIYKLDAGDGHKIGKIDIDEATEASDIQFSLDGTAAYVVDQGFNSYHIFNTVKGQRPNDVTTIFNPPSSFGPGGADPSHPCVPDALDSVTSERPFLMAPEAQIVVEVGNVDPFDAGLHTVNTGVDFDT